MVLLDAGQAPWAVLLDAGQPTRTTARGCMRMRMRMRREATLKKHKAAYTQHEGVLAPAGAPSQVPRCPGPPGLGVGAAFALGLAARYGLPGVGFMLTPVMPTLTRGRCAYHLLS